MRCFLQSKVRWLPMVFLVVACTKNKPQELTATTLQTGTSVNLYQAYFLDDDNGYAVGGVRDTEGYIFKTLDGGATWTTYTNSEPVNIYAVAFKDADYGFAGGDFLRHLTTTDGGSSWQIDWMSANELPFHEVNRPAVRKFHVLNDSLLYAIGGENYQTGTIYRSDNGGVDWSFDTLNHELRGIDFWNEQEGIAVGFGYVGTTDDGLTWNQTDFEGDMLTDVEVLDNDDVLVCSYNNVVYKSNDRFATYETVLQGNPMSPAAYKRFNALDADGAFVVAAGESGTLYYSEDSGATWKGADTEAFTDNYRDVVITASFVYLCGEEGQVYQVDRAQFK